MLGVPANNVAHCNIDAPLDFCGSWLTRQVDVRKTNSLMEKGAGAGIDSPQRVRPSITRTGIW